MSRISDVRLNLLLVPLALAGMLVTVSCKKSTPPATDAAVANASPAAPQVADAPASPLPVAAAPVLTPPPVTDTFAMPENPKSTASGLKYLVEAEGAGVAPQKGQIVSVHYTGWLTDGTKFDSSRGRDPIDFTLGVKEVIPGWDEGIGLLKVGGKATLVIPPELGYGEKGTGGVIPPNATLVFKVELVGVK